MHVENNISRCPSIIAHLSLPIPPSHHIPPSSAFLILPRCFTGPRCHPYVSAQAGMAPRRRVVSRNPQTDVANAGGQANTGAMAGR